METTPPPKVKGLLILHMGFFMGQLIFALLSLFLVSTKSMSPPVIDEYHGEIILGLALLAAIAFLLSRFLYKRKLKAINTGNDSLGKQLDLLRGANVTRWALLQGMNILCIIFFLLTTEYDIFILVIALLLVFFISRPTAINIATDLKIREAEILNMR